MQHELHRIPLCPEMAAYWQTFRLTGESLLPLDQAPCAATDVLIAFVAPDETGTLHFAGPDIPTREMVCALRSQGKNVLLSIGGGGVTVTLNTPEQVTRFAQSLHALVEDLCVNGIDIDVEQGMAAEGTPTQPEGTLAGLIQALDYVLSCLPRSFLLTLAPEAANLVGGITRYGGAYGSYLPLLLHFGSRITRVHMQYYNTGPMTGLDGRTYEPGTVEFAVNMTDAIVKGFPIADTGVYFPGLPTWKVSIGLPATPRAASNGYLTPEQVSETLRWLRSGYRGPNAPLVSAYTHLGGLMTWSLQWDALNHFAFVRHGAWMLGISRGRPGNDIP